MKHLKLINLSAVALSLAFVFALDGNALARHGADDQTVTSTQTQHTETEVQHGGSGSGSVTRTKTVTHTEVETENHDTAADGKPHGELRRKGAGLVAELRKEHKGQKAEARQKKCESRKQGLGNKFNRIVTNSQRIQNRFDRILDKAVQYQKDTNLVATDGSDQLQLLILEAQDAKTKSADSITALKSVTPTLDCNNASVADDVATFKAAAQQARDNLKSYRKAVKSVLRALETAKPAQAEVSNP